MNNRISILQVEDTEEDVVLMKYGFEAAGIKNPVHTVPHAQAAMEYINGTGRYRDREVFPQPDLILLDLKLPGMSGLELLSWIRTKSAQKTVPIIVLTSSAQGQDVENAYKAGANAFITKPSGIDELIEVLRALDVFWLRHTQFPSRFVTMALLQ